MPPARSRKLSLEQLEARLTLSVAHLVHISVDGLAGRLLEDLVRQESIAPRGRYANYLFLSRNGAATFNARTDVTHTTTLPNHVTMITGRPVLPPAGQPPQAAHLWTANSDPPANATLHANHPADDYLPSVFDVVHDRGLSTALFATKTKFSLFDVSYDEVHGAPDSDPTAQDNGRDKIDVGFITTDATQMLDQLIVQLADQDFHYTFVHFADPDIAGHRFGWGSTEWNEAVAKTDAYLGRILQTIQTDPQLAGSTGLLLTADHGGSGSSHGDPTNTDHYQIPFFAFGPGLPANADLYDVFSDQVRDPGTAHPGYTAPFQPIRNGHSGNLALAWLGLGSIPGSTIAPLNLPGTTSPLPVPDPDPPPNPDPDPSPDPDSDPQPDRDPQPDPVDPGQALVRLAVTDPSGQPRSRIHLGSAFQVHAFVRDARPAARGIEAAYLDLPFPANRVEPYGEFRIDSQFSTARSGTVRSGLLDEAGGTCGSPPNGAAEHLLFTASFRATALGPVRLMADPADELPDHAIRVAEGAAVPSESVQSLPVTFEIVGFHNLRQPLDVNDDGFISPIDALIVINQINRRGSRSLLEVPADVGFSPDAYVDTDGDAFLAPLDALRVINHLNRAD